MNYTELNNTTLHSPDAFHNGIGRVVPMCSRHVAHSVGPFDQPLVRHGPYKHTQTQTETQTHTHKVTHTHTHIEWLTVPAHTHTHTQTHTHTHTHTHITPHTHTHTHTHRHTHTHTQTDRHTPWEVTGSRGTGSGPRSKRPAVSGSADRW